MYILCHKKMPFRYFSLILSYALNQVNVPAASSGTPFPRTPQIIFANWREALHHSGLSSGIRAVYGMAVERYLDYCENYTHVMNRPGLGIRSPVDAREVES